jgi:hypothetical protein
LMTFAKSAEKQCARCSAVKPLDDFHRQPKGPMGRHSWCKPCANAYERATRNKQTTPQQRKRWNLMTKYGISMPAFLALMEAQNGLCAICMEPMLRPRVDHDHKTGIVRGLLCHACNIKLAAIEDVDYMNRAVRYLKKAR